MNGNKYLLDTNIVIAYFNREMPIRQRLSNIVIHVPSIVLGELYLGAYNSARVPSNLQQIEDLIGISTIIACDKITANHYGQVKHQLRVKGRPIPENDIWIAAIAMQHGLTLVTRDEHFDTVDHLQTEAW